jgi:hypothetical protein
VRGWRRGVLKSGVGRHGRHAAVAYVSVLVNESADGRHGGRPLRCLCLIWLGIRRSAGAGSDRREYGSVFADESADGRHGGRPLRCTFLILWRLHSHEQMADTVDGHYGVYVRFRGGFIHTSAWRWSQRARLPRAMARMAAAGNCNFSSSRRVLGMARMSRVPLAALVESAMLCHASGPKR